MEIDLPPRIERLVIAARRWGDRRENSQSGERLDRWLRDRRIGEELLRQEIEARRLSEEQISLHIGNAAIIGGSFTSNSLGIEMPTIANPLPPRSVLNLDHWTTGWEKDGADIRPVFGNKTIYVTLLDIADTLNRDGQLVVMEPKVESSDSLTNK